MSPEHALVADGHTASLFPETSALEVHDRWVVANPVLKLDTTRITLTVPILNTARAVIFLVAGEDKAEALREILEGDADPRAYPAKLVQPPAGRSGCSTSPPHLCSASSSSDSS